MNLGYKPLLLRMSNILRIDTSKCLDVTVQEPADFALRLVEIYTSAIDTGCFDVKMKCLSIY
jgi:hypothetical protein